MVKKKYSNFFMDWYRTFKIKYLVVSIKSKLIII